jgi:uroporphyrinogen-III synthase
MMESKRPLHGLRIAGFESRRAEEMTHLLTTAGASAFVSPSMREVGIEDNEALHTFGRALIAGEFDILVLTTGVGFRIMLRSLEGHVDTAAVLEALGRLITIARGPKPVAALKEVGLSPTVRIGEPNTWRDILAACKAEMPKVRGARIAIQEYGQPNYDLISGLEALGAIVTPVRVYEWALPEDLAPLEANIRRIIASEIDVVLFTSSRQVLHVLQVARDLGVEGDLRNALASVRIGSIGPSTSETLRELDFAVGFEPAHPRLGHLVNAVALSSPPDP